MNEEKKKGGQNWQIPVICLSAIIIVAMLCFRPTGKKVTLEQEITQQEITQQEQTTTLDTQATQMQPEEESADLLYGFDRNKYYVYEGDVQQGELLVNILQPYTKYGNILAIAEKSKNIFDLARKMQVNHHWAVFCHTNEVGESVMEHFVYEINSEDILVVSILDGNIDIERKAKEGAF